MLWLLCSLPIEYQSNIKPTSNIIRKTYEADWDSRSSDRRQMAVALYFIDKLALRAGHEKDEDEADTVGCCTLKCENVEVLEGNTIRFDFLGKDSIRYENEVDVDPRVFRAVREFKARFPDGSGAWCIFCNTR